MAEMRESFLQTPFGWQPAFDHKPEPLQMLHITPEGFAELEELRAAAEAMTGIPSRLLRGPRG